MKIGPFTPPDVREAILLDQLQEFEGVPPALLPDLVFSVAGVAVLVQAHLGVPLGTADEQMLAPFLFPSPQRPRFHVTASLVIDHFPVPDDVPGNVHGEMNRQAWRITSSNWRTIWESRSAQYLTIEYRGNLVNLLNAVRLFLAHQLLQNNLGLFLHASAAVFHGTTYVFLGHSGAGKSTSAYHTPGALLADETIAIVNNHQGQIMALGTPFGGEHFPCAIPGPNPVFLFVEKSDRNARKTIPTRNAVARLLSQVVLFPFAPLELWDQAAAWVERILENHPVEILEAKKDGSFWKDCLS